MLIGSVSYPGNHPLWGNTPLMLDGSYESLFSHLIHGRAEELLHVAHPISHNGTVCATYQLAWATTAVGLVLSTQNWSDQCITFRLGGFFWFIIIFQFLLFIFFWTFLRNRFWIYICTHFYVFQFTFNRARLSLSITVWFSVLVCSIWLLFDFRLFFGCWIFRPFNFRLCLFCSLFFLYWCGWDNWGCLTAASTQRVYRRDSICITCPSVLSKVFVSLKKREFRIIQNVIICPTDSMFSSTNQ